MTAPKNQKCGAVHVAGLIVWIAIAGACYWLTLRPLVSGRERAESHKRELAIEQRKGAAVTAAIKSLQTRLEAYTRIVASSPLHLEPATHLNSRLAELVSLAKAAGLTIQDIRPTPGVTNPRFDMVSVHMSGQGSYRSCVLFLHKLHDTFLDTAVASFHLAGNPTDAAAPASFDFEFHWFAAPARTASLE